jgi:PAS domain S-box-containing protein
MTEGSPLEPEKIHLESLPDAVLVVDRKGVIVRANSRAEELFGYPHEKMVGQSIELLIPERFRERHTGHREGYAAAPQVRPMGRGMRQRARGAAARSRWRSCSVPMPPDW